MLGRMGAGDHVERKGVLNLWGKITETLSVSLKVPQILCIVSEVRVCVNGTSVAFFARNMDRFGLQS